MARRVLHLVGSAVSEFHCDLSRLYAGDCLRATADPERYEPLLAYVTPDRRWRFPTGLDPAEIEAAAPVSLAAAIEILEALAIDVAVPQMFCLPGMTVYRGLLELLEIPYVGNRPQTMAATADKALAKSIVAAAGVAVPAGVTVGPGEVPAVRLPAVVKPIDADNSLGVSLVRDRTDLPAALETAFDHADRVLVENYVELGREVRCGLLEIDGELVPLPLEEYAVAAELPIRALADKLRRGRGDELALVAKDGERAWMVDRDDPLTPVVWEAAKACHLALGCRHYGLFDFRIDPAGWPWFLEAGLYCSFARQSVISMMAAESGLPIRDLFAIALREAWASPRCGGNLLR